MKGNHIPWEEFKDTYNKRHKTQYKTAKEWMEDLYKKHNKFVNPLAEELGVGFGTVSKYLEIWGLLERKLKGGHNYKIRPIGKKEQLFLQIPEKAMKELTKDQICVRCGMSSRRFGSLIKKHKRGYLKFKQH